MAHNRTITGKMSEGCKPSALPDRRIRPSGRGKADADLSHVAGESTIADARSLTHSLTITRSPSPKASAKERREDADDRLPPCRPADRPGCGGLAGRAAAGPRNARGPLAQTQSGFGVGDRVVNASGRGAWGVGTIVAVIPAGVNPRWWCRRNGWPLMFGRCETVHRPRYVVRDDRGKLVVPRNIGRTD